MRLLNFFYLINLRITIVTSLVLMTWDAGASTPPPRATRSDYSVHLLNNLKDPDLDLVMKIMEERGYKVVDREIFSRSKDTVSITKSLGDESEAASIEIQVFTKTADVKLPTEVFRHKTITEDLQKALEALPRPSELPVLGQAK